MKFEEIPTEANHSLVEFIPRQATAWPTNKKAQVIHYLIGELRLDDISNSTGLQSSRNSMSGATLLKDFPTLIF